MELIRLNRRELVVYPFAFRVLIVELARRSTSILAITMENDQRIFTLIIVS